MTPAGDDVTGGMLGVPVLMCTDAGEPVVVCVGMLDRRAAADAAYLLLAAHVGFERLEARLELAAPELPSMFSVSTPLMSLLMAVDYAMADLDEGGMHVGAGCATPVTVVHCSHLVGVEVDEEGVARIV